MLRGKTLEDIVALREEIATVFAQHRIDDIETQKDIISQTHYNNVYALTENQKSFENLDEHSKAVSELPKRIEKQIQNVALLEALKDEWTTDM